MIEKLKLEIPVLLPENGECADCVQRLQEALHLQKALKRPAWIRAAIRPTSASTTTPT